MYNHPLVQLDLEQLIADNPGIHWDKLRGQRILVTGINGMIGTYLCLLLLKLNDSLHLDLTILGLARNGQKARLRLASILQRPDFQLLVQDLGEPLRLEQPVDRMIHAASQTGPRQFTADPVGTIDANVIGTRHLLEWGRQHQVGSFLFLSTREIYGENSEHRPFVTEDEYGPLDPTKIRSCYPESKRLGEMYCMAFRHQHQIDCKIARIAHTFGPGMTIGDGRVVGDFLQNVVDGANIEMNSDGSGVLALTYIADVIAGLFLLMLDSDETVCNISNDSRTLTVRELAELLMRFNGNPQARTVFKAVSAQVKSGYLASPPALLKSSRIAAAGWQPRVSLEEGFRRTVDFYRTTRPTRPTP